MDSVFNLKEFDLNKGLTLRSYPYNVIISGRQKSGKTTMVIDILHKLYMVGFTRVCVFTDIVHRSKYSNHNHDGLICDSNNIMERLEELLMLQQSLFRHRSTWEIKKTEMYLVIVIDACKDEQIRYSSLMGTLVVAGRCYGIRMIFTTENPILLNTDLRYNCDHFIQLKEFRRDIITALYRNEFRHFDRISSFRDCLENVVTQDFTGLIMDHTCFRSDVQARVKIYKAKQGRQFMFGIDDRDWYRRRCLVLPRNMQIPQTGILGLNEDIFREIVGYL